MNRATAIAGAGTDGDVTPARLGLGAHEYALRMEFNPASGVLGLIGGQNQPDNFTAPQGASEG
jgi:hypothetical protein